MIQNEGNGLRVGLSNLSIILTRNMPNLKEKIRALPHKPGVYLMKDRFGTILYVGKAKDLKKRVSTYFQASRNLRKTQPKIEAMVRLVADLDFLEVKSEPEALLLEGRLIKEWKPRYNTDFTDDKRFLMVRLDLRSPLPRFRLARVRSDDQSRYFGPFAHSGLLRKTLAEMRRRFGVLLGDATPERLTDGTWRLYQDVRAEIYGHANVVTEEDYHQRMEKAAHFLEGKSKEWLEELREEMLRAAEAKSYEKAAELRDIVLALEKTLAPTRRFTRGPVTRENPRDVLPRLGEVLVLDAPPRTMECFDISHISGSFCVASMVRFREGLPEKAQYRRFQIRGNIGNDDYQAMFQVVGRRYRRLHDENRPFPDLIVIDGGLGQVRAALAAFHAHDLTSPPLIGLAKREEHIIFPEDRPPLALPPHDPSLRLLQRIRDEAHRFANTYNADLRSRRIRESLLEDCPGLGPQRRAILLTHFRSLEALRKASAEDIQNVEGIGPILARQIVDFLNHQSG